MSEQRKMIRRGFLSKQAQAQAKLVLGKDNNDVQKRDEQRAQILNAFIAKTGLLPSECEQVTVHGQNGMRWYIRKRVAAEPTREVK